MADWITGAPAGNARDLIGRMVKFSTLADPFGVGRVREVDGTNVVIEHDGEESIVSWLDCRAIEPKLEPLYQRWVDGSLPWAWMGQL